METQKKWYNVLVADDEYWTREKLRNMVAWEEYGLNFLEPAEDGEDALEKIRMYRPDIFITDINMPFLSGVEILEKVQEELPEMITFVISGYDDFEYVKSTFMSGAINYLVKPVTQIELVRALSMALEKISERESEKLELLKAASIMQDREFSQMIQRQDMAYMPTFSDNQSAMMAGMSLVLVKMHNLWEAVSAGGLDMNLLSFRVKKKIKEIFGDGELIVFNNVYRLNEFLIVTDKSDEALGGLAEKLKVQLPLMIESYMTICVSAHTYSIDSIHMAYVETVGLLMTRRYRPRHEIIMMKDRKKELERAVAHFDTDCERQMKTALAAGKLDSVKEIVFEKTDLKNCEKNGWSYLEVRQTIRQILNVLSDYAIQESGHSKVGEVESYTDILDKAVETMDYKTLAAMLMDVIGYLAPVKKEAASDSMKEIVRQAVSWIDAHYLEEISLTSLAERYHVESSYLSKMFRQETGESLILYITRKRMEKAKEYVRDMKMSLTEIAFLVGYDDYTYFSRVFKKNTGMNPREYRSRHKEEIQ